MKNKVNLFIIGAMKAGTTTLHDYLSEHKDIYMSPVKEPGFFVKELWGNKSTHDYENLFLTVKNERYIGESSTHYTKIPTYNDVPQRIHQYNSSAKFVYIVRNPIDRTISHYHHNCRDLMYGAERRNLFSAIKHEKSYLDYSNYAMQLEPYYRLFGRSKIFIIKFEKLIEKPEIELNKLLRWLNVEDSQGTIKDKKLNATPQVYNIVRGFGMLNKIRFSKTWSYISPMAPKAIKRFLNFYADKKIDKQKYKKIELNVYEYMQPILKDYIVRLEELTGCSFHEWLL